MCSRPRSHSHRPGEFLLAVEGLKGWLAPGFGMWVRSGGEKGAPECAPPQLCGRTWEPVEGAGGTSSLTSPPWGQPPQTGRKPEDRKPEPPSGGAAARPARAEEGRLLLPQHLERTRGTVSLGSSVGKGVTSHQKASSQLNPQSPTSNACALFPRDAKQT